MAIGLVFLTLLMGGIVWWLLRQTVGVQPWQSQAALPRPALPVQAVRTALWVFLGVATSLFVLFVSAYAMRLGAGDWEPLPRPRLLMVNTGLLAGASVAMAWAVRGARGADRTELLRRLAVAGVLTLAFLAGQVLVWSQFARAGYLVASSAASAFFYLFTAVHGVHVLGGLVAWGRAGARAWRGGDAARVRLGVELCAAYWHYLLAVWVVLYALLVSQDLGLAICSSTPL
jgi:cytochrome c oxidase subunit 3